MYKRIFVMSVVIFLITSFIGLSTIGYFLKPGEPIVRLNPCWRGIQPTIAFGGNPNFIVSKVKFGPRYSRFLMLAAGWPGGVIGLTIVRIGVCPEITQDEMDEVIKKRYETHPELFDDEDKDEDKEETK